MVCDHKYYIIKRSINGRLVDVYGVDKKADVIKTTNDHLRTGYQITTVLRSVMMTADNLFEARAFLGLPQMK